MNLLEEIETAMTEIEDNYKKTLHPSGIVILTEKMNNVRAVSLGFWIRIGSRKV